eukprot:TRINITY_DN23601_c0_g1_i1.p1 TRINITY_DN23601_c0_g1~~TRINITY_DN23601_c0_g1_i1.p1  ORF type:complete len:562 (-),score=128.06 TRINITY_DN23601_c0_g1_i1:99-1784(-)
MPEFHPGTDVEIPDAVPSSQFRCAIPNTKRYMKHNRQTLEMVCKASYEGDCDRLQVLLADGDEMNLFNGDLNAHLNNSTALMLAASTGQLECVELLLQARADPHMQERMPHGKDPDDGKTAREIAYKAGWDDVVKMLEDAERTQPYGYYVPEGPSNNAKVYGGFQWGTKPEKGWYSSRPGVAERNGFDPKKYDTGAYRQPPEAFPQPGVAAPPRSAAAASSSVSAAVATPAPAAALRQEQQSAAGSGGERLPVALLFPGQGSQYVGMLAKCKDLPAVKSLLARAERILGWDLLELCLNGPEAKLEETRFCQPVMFVAGIAGLEVLRSQREELVTQFEATAGLSLGEYTALCAAGVFDFEDGLRLVQLRGEAMQEAAGLSRQAMLSVAGLGKEQLNALCREAATREGPDAVCQVANELFPKGFACAGTEASIKALKELADAAGALQSKQLKTSGGFHTRLMAPAARRLGEALHETLPRMRPPRHTIYMNVTAEPLAVGTDPQIIVDMLEMQLTSSVLWESSMRAMIGANIKEFYEVGPMKQLKAMLKRIDPKIFNATTSLEL